MANPYLREGMTDDAVKRVKKILSEHGYWNLPVTSPLFGPRLTDAVVYFQQTHQNEQGRPCGVDGKVGPETWWALENPDGPAQRSNLSPKIPSGITEGRRKILETALGYHGVREQPNGSNRGPEVDTFLPRWWLNKNGPKAKGPAWCCFFMSACNKEALDSFALGRRHGSCQAASKDAKRLGIWKPNDGSYTPQPGDAFVMLKGNGKGHIGWVLRVSEDGSAINTCEGNCGNRVKVGMRDTDERIAGYIQIVPAGPAGFERGLIEAPNVGGAGTR